MIESLYWTIQSTFIINIKTVLKFAIPIYAIIYLLFKVKNKNKKKSLYKILIEFCFTGYIVTVLLLTEILSINLANFNSIKLTPNLIPLLETVKDFMYYPYGAAQQILLNIIFFIPFGIFFLCIYNRKNKLKIMTITSVLFSLFIECTQYFSGRYFDIDDIIWNTIGAIIGLLIYSFIQKIASKKDTIQELVTK